MTYFCTALSGVTAALGAEAAPVPAALVAVTVKVYAVPSIRPVTVAVVAPLVVAVAPPRLALTVYPVIGIPPSAGAVQDTVALPSPACAVGVPGTDGAVTPRTDSTAATGSIRPAPNSSSRPRAPRS